MAQKCLPDEMNEHIVFIDLGVLGKEEEYTSTVCSLECELVFLPLFYDWGSYLTVERLPSRQSIADTLYLETLLESNIMEERRENEASFSFCKLCIHSFTHSFMHSFSFSSVSPHFFRNRELWGSVFKT